MPELPEVETVVRYLRPRVTAARVAEVHVRRADLRYPVPVDAVVALQGCEITGVHRRAKYLLFDFTERTVLVHLGMSGRLFIEPSMGQPWEKHEHWRWHLDGPNGDGPHLLRYIDARRFGALDVFENEAETRHPLLERLGPEPLGPLWTPTVLLEACAGRTTAIKQLLMDGHIIVGVGNIYASETCFRAATHPLRPAGTLSAAECERLVAASRSVLQDAIDAGGSTLKDFVGGDAAPGYFQQQLDVYGRQGQRCHRCSGLVGHCSLGGRATYFCGGCQA